MAQQPNVPREAYDLDTFSGRSYALARFLSRLFNPIVLNIVSFLIVGAAALATPAEGLQWAALCILVLILPPTMFYYVRLRQGVYSDEDVSIRQQRNELYAIGFAWVLISMLILGWLGLPRPFMGLLVCGLAMGLVGGFVNLFWKISAHASSIAATATIALLYSRPLGLVLWVCAIAVGWARVRTRNHTPMQVLAGFGSAVLIVLVVFGYIGPRGS
jgi:membrane-associated phospholipid phosphatase